MVRHRRRKSEVPATRRAKRRTAANPELFQRLEPVGQEAGSDDRDSLGAVARESLERLLRRRFEPAAGPEARLETQRRTLARDDAGRDQRLERAFTVRAVDPCAVVASRNAVDA